MNKDLRLNDEEIEKMKEIFISNKEKAKKRKENKMQKKTYSAKQRKIDDLSRKKRSTYWKLQNQVDEMFQKNSKVSKKNDEKETKKDVKKGLKAEGIWSISTYKNYLKKSKTFIKYCVKEHDVKNLRDIKPGMVVSFIESHIARNSSPKTIGGYMSSIKKMSEFGQNEGIKSMSKLASTRAQELVPMYNSDEYRRGKKGGYTVKDVQVIAKKAEELYSPYHRAAVEVFGFSGPRMDEFLKLKWKHLDFENNRIYLTDENMTKGNRPRYLPANEKTMKLLKEIKDLSLHSNDNERIWGSKMNRDDVREFIKTCAKAGKTKYSGVHDFRRSTVHYHQKMMEKEMKKGTLDKAKLVKQILDHVGVDPRLNPLIEKKVPKRNADGKVMYKTRKNGQIYPVMVKEKDENGNVIKKHKYVKEELMERRIDYLKNLYLSQILGHNRTDITAVYKK